MIKGNFWNFLLSNRWEVLYTPFDSNYGILYDMPGAKWLQIFLGVRLDWSGATLNMSSKRYDRSGTTVDYL